MGPVSRRNSRMACVTKTKTILVALAACACFLEGCGGGNPSVTCSYDIVGQKYEITIECDGSKIKTTTKVNGKVTSTTEQETGTDQSCTQEDLDKLTNSAVCGKSNAASAAFQSLQSMPLSNENATKLPEKETLSKVVNDTFEADKANPAVKSTQAVTVVSKMPNEEMV